MLVVFMTQEFGYFQDHHDRLGNSEQGELQAGRQREGSGRAAEKRSVEGR